MFQITNNLCTSQVHKLFGGIAQLVERRPCNWVVEFAGWMLSLLSGNDSIVYPNRWLTFPRNGEEDCNMPLKSGLLKTFLWIRLPIGSGSTLKFRKVRWALG